MRVVADTNVETESFCSIFLFIVDQIRDGRYDQ